MLAKFPESADHDEVGKFVLGPPGLQAHVPVRRSAFRWLGRVFRRDPRRLVRVWHGQVVVSAYEDDDGSIDVYLDVVNFSHSPVDVQGFNLSSLMAGGYSVAVTSAMFTPPREFLRPGEMQRVHFRCPIASAGIRRVLQSIQVAQNPRSSPRLEIKVWGTLVGVAGKKAIRDYMEVVIDSPILNFSNPGSRA